MREGSGEVRERREWEVCERREWGGVREKGRCVREGSEEVCERREWGGVREKGVGRCVREGSEEVCERSGEEGRVNWSNLTCTGYLDSPSYVIMSFNQCLNMLTFYDKRMIQFFEILRM